MPQDVLVVIDTVASIPRRLKLVAALAKQADIRITGAFVTGLPGSAAFADLQGWAVMVDAYMTSQRDEAAKAEAAFRSEMGQLKLAGEWLFREADLTESVTTLARLHDLVVLGQPEPSEPVIALRPDHAQAHVNRGAALYGLQRYESALASYDKAIALRPDHPKARWSRSLCLLKMGQLLQGWQELEWSWVNKTIYV